jgi:glutamyl-tRNA(Gln) amidotransferase subunit E
MYPESDLPLLRISRDFINECKKDLPELKSEVEESLRKQGLSQEVIKDILRSDRLEEYKELFNIFGNASLIGKMMFLLPKEIASKEKRSVEELRDIFNQTFFTFVLEKIRDKELDEGRLKEVFSRVYSGEDVKDAVIFEEVNLNEVEEEIMKIIRSKPGLSPNAYMGLVMASMKGKISGNDAMAIIKKYCN